MNILPILLLTLLTNLAHAFYNPVEGRWCSRDPIEEAGGPNLYGFTANDGVNGIDLLGQRPGDGLDTGFPVAPANRGPLENFPAAPPDLQPDGAIHPTEPYGLDAADYAKSCCVFDGDWKRVYAALAEAARACLDAARKDLATRQATFTRLTPKRPWAKPTLLFEFGARVCAHCNFEKGGFEYYHPEPVSENGPGSISPLKMTPCRDGDMLIGTAHNHPSDRGLSGWSGDSRIKSDRGLADWGYEKQGAIQEKYLVPPMKSVAVQTPDGTIEIYNPATGEKFKYP